MNKSAKTSLKDLADCDINKVFLGLIIVIFGFAFLLSNLKIVSSHFDISLLWPLFIIFIGLSLLRKKSAVSAVVGSIVTALCVFLVFVSFFSTISIKESAQTAVSVFPVTVSLDPGVTKAEISLNAGVGEIKVYGMDSKQLIDGNLTTNLFKAKVDSKTADGIQKVNLEFKKNSGWMRGSDFKNDLSLGINNNVPLDILINSGASDNNIDLSDIKAESVSVHTGASSVNLKMGDALDANVIIEAGASSINLIMPKTAGVKLIIESGLSSQNLPDFTSVNKNTYQSSNYESSEKKINVDIKMGMASLSVNWYEPPKKTKVSLFYYNQLEDKENVCGYDFILPVEREITVNDDVIKETIEKLIQGELTEEEKASGFTTNLPNPDFKLLGSSLSDKGVLTLEFTEVPGLTSDSSCQTGLLFEEILKTVRQFPEVKIVIFKPDTLFESFI